MRSLDQTIAFAKGASAESGASSHRATRCQLKGWKGKGMCRLAVNHTNTTRSHISGNHDRALSRLEFVQDPIAFILLFVAMDCCLESAK